jgi:hypothetical protein
MFGARFAITKPLTLIIPVFVLVTVSPATAEPREVGKSVYRTGEDKYLPYFARGSDKVSAGLKVLKEEFEAQGITRETARQFRLSTRSNRMVKVNDRGDLQTYIHVQSLREGERSQLETYNVSIEKVNKDMGIIRAWIPFDVLNEVAQLPFIRRITPPRYPTTMVGSVTTEGDSILKADQLRALGFDGTGVRVGVISDGVTNWVDAQASGDLPAAVTVQTHAGSGDEGTAMLEIVHDLAPGAELGFCGPADSLEMVDCVSDLANVFGADIIVDDLGFFGEPYFEDGIVAHSVATVVSGGVFYTTSAGNHALVHYQGQYEDSGDGNGSHLIGPGNDVFEVTGSNVLVILQWSNQDGFAGDDYDLCLETEDAFTCASSNDIQDGDDIALEYRTAPTVDCTLGCNFQVRLVSGSGQTLELFVLGGTLDDANDQVLADSIIGQQAVTNAIAAAAIDASDPGNDDIEPFSSRGPSTIFFPSQQVRQKPDLSAIDGVSVTGAGGFPSPFYGTSASSPHIAGVAALLMSGGRTASAVRTALRRTAVDLGPGGRDSTYGYGRIDALAAHGFLEGALQFELRVDDDDGGGSSNDFCFIATAAHDYQAGGW